MNVLSDKAIEQLRRLVREENSKYRNAEPLRRRWTGGQPAQILIGKTNASCTAPDTVEVSVWAGDDDDLADLTGTDVTAFSLAYDLDSGIFVKLTPYGSISGIVGASGAKYLAEPLECNA